MSPTCGDDDPLTPKELEINAFEARAQDIEDDKHKFLRKHGWSYSSSYPDFTWRWSKTVNGQHITDTRADGAIRVEGRLP